MIGDDIELTVVDIRGDKVRIGIKAPTHIAVHRKEIYDAIKRENEQAAMLGGSDVRSLRPKDIYQQRTRRSVPAAAKLNDPNKQQPDQRKRESA
jgi:carbon storage regulator